MAALSLSGCVRQIEEMLAAATGPTPDLLATLLSGPVGSRIAEVAGVLEGDGVRLNASLYKPAGLKEPRPCLFTQRPISAGVAYRRFVTSIAP